MSAFSNDHVAAVEIVGTSLTIADLETVEDCDQAIVLLSQAVRSAHLDVALLRDRADSGARVSHTELASTQNDLAEARTALDLVRAKRGNLFATARKHA